MNSSSLLILELLCILYFTPLYKKHFMSMEFCIIFGVTECIYDNSLIFSKRNQYVCALIMSLFPLGNHSVF